jgi:hypothetical protein
LKSPDSEKLLKGNESKIAFISFHELAFSCIDFREFAPLVASPPGSTREHSLRRRVGEPVRRCDRLAGELPVMHVQARAQVGIVL